MSISGTNPVASSVSQDECWGVNAKKDGSFSALLTIKMTELRESTKGDFKDVLLILFNSSGAVVRSVVFTHGSIAQSMLLTNNALINIDDQFFFAGQSVGYQTKLQKLIYTKDVKTGGLTTTAKTDLDAYIYRYIFDRQSDQCVYSTEVPAATTTRRITAYSGVAVGS